LSRKIDKEKKKFLNAEISFSNKLIAELEPFVTVLREMPEASPDLKRFKQAYLKYLGKEEHYKKISRYLMKGSLKVTEPLKDKLQFVFWYLCVLETVNHTAVNILIILVNTSTIKGSLLNFGNNGYLKRIGKAFSLEDLEKRFIPLGSKIDFLRANGLKEVAAVIDTEFRNDIVHFNFDIHDEDIAINGKKILPLVVANVHKLLSLSAVVNKYLRKLAIEKRFFDITVEC